MDNLLLNLKYQKGVTFFLKFTKLLFRKMFFNIEYKFPFQRGYFQ